jgi:hypothetical protein
MLPPITQHIENIVVRRATRDRQESVSPEDCLRHIERKRNNFIHSNIQCLIIITETASNRISARIPSSVGPVVIERSNWSIAKPTTDKLCAIQIIHIFKQDVHGAGFHQKVSIERILHSCLGHLEDSTVKYPKKTNVYAQAAL